MYLHTPIYRYMYNLHTCTFCLHPLPLIILWTMFKRWEGEGELKKGGRGGGEERRRGGRKGVSE